MELKKELRKSGLWYVSQPARLGGSGKKKYRTKVLDELILRGYDVIHPFNAFPYENFEGNKYVGRELAMKYCCDLVEMCKGRIIVTGISEGVLKEIDYALSMNNPTTDLVLLPEYDPEWTFWLKHYEQLNIFPKAQEHILLIQEQTQ